MLQFPILLKQLLYTLQAYQDDTRHKQDSVSNSSPESSMRSYASVHRTRPAYEESLHTTPGGSTDFTHDIMDSDTYRHFQPQLQNVDTSVDVSLSVAN